MFNGEFLHMESQSMISWNSTHELQKTNQPIHPTPQLLVFIATIDDKTCLSSATIYY